MKRMKLRNSSIQFCAQFSLEPICYFCHRTNDRMISFSQGDPVLRQRAPEVPLDKIKSDEIKKLVAQMKSVLRNYNLVGLAAPQIGVSYRVIVMEASEQLKEKYPKTVYDNRQMSLLPMTVSIKWHCITAAIYQSIYLYTAINIIHMCVCVCVALHFSYEQDIHQSRAQGEKFQYKNVPRRMCQCMRLYR